MASLKRPPHLSPSSFRDETESAAIPDPTNILRGIAKYLDALSPEDKSSPLALLLGTCAMQINDLMARSTMSIEDAIEREKRDRSVVVMGLTESVAVKPSERVADDMAKVVSMLDLAEVEHSPATVFRMGVKTDTRPRLLKVVFHTRTAQSMFLAKSRALSTQFPSVSIRPSLTKAEREAAYQLRQKKRALKSEGKDVLIYAGSIIERGQLEAMKKQLRSSRSQSRSRRPRTPAPSIFNIASLLAPQTTTTPNATTALPELATHSLSCQYYNIRSIVNKLDSFRTFLMSSQPDIVFLTETWLSAKIPSSLIIGSLPYTVIRFDRSSRGGGVCILLRDYLSYSTVSLPSSDHEITCIDLFHSYAYIRLCLVYRPPSYSLPKTESLISCLSDIHASSPHPIIITGDFNSDSLCTLPNSIDRVFRDFILSADLSHLNVTPTRGSKCIDWVLGNDPSLIPCISIIPPFPSCDHSGLSFSINSPQSPSLPSKIRDFSRADFSALSSHLHSIDWFSLFRDCPDIESVYTNFTSTIHSAIDTFVPYRTPRPPTLSYPPHIIRLILHRDALFAKIHFPNVRSFFDQCSKKLLFEIGKWTRYSTRKKLSRVKDLYRHVSSLTKPKLSIPELLSPMNVPVYDSLSKANLLATEFASHFTLDDGCLPPLSSSPIPPSLALFTFFPHE
ncbi:hypothetical protein PRIPAC_75717, partial [Pristionchus pacificus]|uniref:Endonuclease/exonuclease/phosphatase domain-containing protein n=1 Tax=Pristionchus pacificus TaxID=54126 RepID=A0A2A6C0B3_PRIPA